MDQQRVSAIAIAAIIIAVGSFLATLTHHAILGIIAAIIAVPMGIMGFIMAASPRVSGGILSIAAIVIGGFGFIFSMLIGMGRVVF